MDYSNLEYENAPSKFDLPIVQLAKGGIFFGQFKEIRRVNVPDNLNPGAHREAIIAEFAEVEYRLNSNVAKYPLACIWLNKVLFDRISGVKPGSVVRIVETDAIATAKGQARGYDVKVAAKKGSNPIAPAQSQPTGDDPGFESIPF